MDLLHAAKSQAADSGPRSWWRIRMWQERQLIIGVQIDGLLNLRHGERCVLLLSCWLLAHVPGAKLGAPVLV